MDASPGVAAAAYKAEDAGGENPVTTTMDEGPPVHDPCSYASPTDTADYKRSFALNYQLRKKPKVLFAMAMGFPEFHGILDRPPLSTIKRKELNDHFIPKAEDFKQEIKRRSHFFMNSGDEASFYTDELKRSHPLKTKRSSIVLPQPNQWLNTQLKAWLSERPLKPTEDDTKFIRFQIKRVLDYLAKEGADGVSPEVLRELPIVATPTDVDIGPEAIAAATGVPAAAVAAGTMGGGLVGGGGSAAASMAAGLTEITPTMADIDTEPFVYSAPGDTEEYKRSAAETFLQKGGKPRILFALAMGMPEYSEMLQTAAYSLVKRKEVTEDYIPRADDYRFEIKRRAHFFMNVEEEVTYYTHEMKLKNPLENMRGIVSLPQPNQWKLQALKLWLNERPLKPNHKDAEFLTTAIQKCIDALKVAVSNDPSLSQSLSGNKRHSSVLLNMLDPSMGTIGGPPGGASLGQIMSKQDSILNALRTQTKQQALLNKITLLTQSCMGYQQELASLRSTGNEIESRILNVEVKIAETPSGSHDGLKAIIAKQEDLMASVKGQIQDVEGKVASLHADIQAHQEELAQVTAAAAEAENAAAASAAATGMAAAMAEAMDDPEVKKVRYEDEENLTTATV